MLKLRNAVLTALLAFCLAMPFVSCSFNDGATGDVSNLVKEQPGNNQNGGNGGSTGGNEKPSGGDEDSGDNGNENPSGGNNGGSGNENPSGGNEKPGEGTVYTVKYGDTVIASDMTESALSVYVATYGLVEGHDYTIDGAVITLTESGYNKVTSEMPGEGDEPVPDVPVPDVPGDVEGTMYTVKYGDTVIVPAMPESALSSFETAYGLTEVTDYTISGTVITLTEAGYAKVQAAGEGGGQEPGTDEPGSGEVTEYTVKYKGKVLDTISAEEFSAYSGLLTEVTDYTISGTVITLTDSGFEKGKAAGFGAGE